MIKAVLLAAFTNEKIALNYNRVIILKTQTLRSESANYLNPRSGDLTHGAPGSSLGTKAELVKDLSTILRE